MRSCSAEERRGLYSSMKTASTLCASGAGIGLASVGLAVVREEDPRPRDPSQHPSSLNLEMTAVAAASSHSYPHLKVNPALSPTTPHSARSVSEGQNGKVRSKKARVGQKRTLTPRASFSLGAEQLEARSEARTWVETPNNHSRSWLRRLSSSVSMPTSRDSSRTPVSRPGSAALSQANGSVTGSATFSHSGSTTPIFSGNMSSSSSSMPPNKLVKRSSSVRSTSGSLFSSSGSRLPVPVFRRPATSYDRSSQAQSLASQQGYSGTDDGDRMSIDEDSSHPRDLQFRQYFTPKVSSGLLSLSRRRSSSIPNPIKRVYPDRKYTPVLVSANRSTAIKAARVEVDELDFDGERMATASSPLPHLNEGLEEGPRRSFSIGNLLSGGPQPLWKRPPSSGSMSRRRTRQRIVSAPQSTMGNSFSAGNRNGDFERPAKRRDLTDHSLASPSIYASTKTTIHNAHTETRHEMQVDLVATPQPDLHDGNRSPSAEVSLPHLQSSPLIQHRMPSATTVDSDMDYRSVGDDSTDYQSDRVYDSYPTRTTRSSSGRRGPHIEQIFGESPPTFSSGQSRRLKDLLADGDFVGTEFGGQYRPSTIEEEESTISTPVRSLRDKSVASTPSAFPRAGQTFTSSPPDDDIDWDAFDDESAHASHPVARSLPFRFGAALRQPHSSSADATPSRQHEGNTDRASLYGWSEVRQSPSFAHSPPRPKTMHGKKGSDSRGSRSNGRRAPSGMHARSHSVPVVPEVGGRRSNVVANRFGTWGVGSKPVTEDWNDDFDFDDETPEPAVEDLDMDEKGRDGNHGMIVPQSIREQQQNLVANISLLRQWGLLIEELKELRIRAVALDMLNGPYEGDWQEVDAMIELADQETEEQTLAPRGTPPSSPSFDYAAFEDSVNSARAHGRPLRLSAGDAQDEFTLGGARMSPQPGTSQYHHTTRGRKDSEAVARSVIEALQSKRSASDPTVLSSAPQSRKVPFDTATLRHIVPYVDKLKRRVKDALRQTEGLRTSPHRNTARNLDRDDNDDDDEEEEEEGEEEEGEEEDGGPAFRSNFNEPSPNELASRSSRREDAATDHDWSEGSPGDQRSDLASRMQSMNLP